MIDLAVLGLVVALYAYWYANSAGRAVTTPTLEAAVGAHTPVVRDGPSTPVFFPTPHDIVAAADEGSAIIVGLRSGGIVRLPKDGSPADGVRALGDRRIIDLAAGDRVVAVVHSPSGYAGGTGRAEAIVLARDEPLELTSEATSDTRVAVLGRSPCVAEPEGRDGSRARCVDPIDGSVRLQAIVEGHGRPTRSSSRAGRCCS